MEGVVNVTARLVRYTFLVIVAVTALALSGCSPDAIPVTVASAGEVQGAMVAAPSATVTSVVQPTPTAAPSKAVVARPSPSKTITKPVPNTKQSVWCAPIGVSQSGPKPQVVALSSGTMPGYFGTVTNSGYKVKFERFDNDLVTGSVSASNATIIMVYRAADSGKCTLASGKSTSSGNATSYSTRLHQGDHDVVVYVTKSMATQVATETCPSPKVVVRSNTFVYNTITKRFDVKGTNFDGLAKPKLVPAGTSTKVSIAAPTGMLVTTHVIYLKNGKCEDAYNFGPSVTIKAPSSAIRYVWGTAEFGE